MDDLAPAPAERTFNRVGRTPEPGLAARRKAAKKVPPAPAKAQHPEPEPAPETESAVEANHQLDVLA